MKLIAFLFTSVLFIMGDTIDTVSWNSTEYNFGEIQQNIPATATYELTNNSKESLVIENVKVGCGCTSTGYTKEPIAPGESTIIEATFNAKKIGKFTKTAKVTTNLNEEPTVLRFNGEVVRS